jgi:hypothetical protein
VKIYLVRERQIHGVWYPGFFVRNIDEILSFLGSFDSGPELAMSPTFYRIEYAVSPGNPCLSLFISSHLVTDAPQESDFEFTREEFIEWAVRLCAVIRVHSE